MFLLAAVIGVSFFFLWSVNPIHQVLTLVVLGVCFAGQLLIEACEFPALILILVYVGAVNVLFIFVIMMVNLRSTPEMIYLNEVSPLWLGVAVGLFGGNSFVNLNSFFPMGFSTLIDQTSSLSSLGIQMYTTDRIILVIIVSLILLISMVAAICLSLVTSENYRTQEFYSQIRKSNAVFVLHRRNSK